MSMSKERIRIEGGFGPLAHLCASASLLLLMRYDIIKQSLLKQSILVAFVFRITTLNFSDIDEPHPIFCVISLLTLTEGSNSPCLHPIFIKS